MTHPSLLASNKAFLYTLSETISLDPFAFAKEGSSALLWIAMHLTDEKPWTTARNPVFIVGSPGSIDSETKRILGKRFQTNPSPNLPFVELDPISLVLQKVASIGFDFAAREILWPIENKTPGKLLPRKLKAEAHVTTKNQNFTLYARNFSEMSQCLHAELTLLFALSERMAQSDEKMEKFRLHSTLKPCKMCAAFLHAVKLHTKHFSVSYDEHDPGPLATDTLLDKWGYQSDI